MTFGYSGGGGGKGGKKPHASTAHHTTAPKAAKPFSPGISAIYSYLDKRHLPHTRANFSKAVSALVNKHTSFPNSKEISITETAAPWQCVYGTMKMGGHITYAAVSDDHTHLMMVITIAGHQISGIDKIFVEGTEVTFASNVTYGWNTGPNLGGGIDLTHKVFVQPYLGDPALAVSTTPYQQLITDSAAYCHDATLHWTNAHRQQGRAGVYIRLEFDNNAFASGPPAITFLVRGKPCYDPRGPITQHTENAALIIADYLQNQYYGVRVSSSEIDNTSLTNAANVCGVVLTNASGKGELTYSINGIFDANEKNSQVLTNMCSAMGGRVTQVEGLWRFWPATYITPTLSLNENDIISDLRVTSRISRNQTFNTVQGTYIEPAKDYQATDFPPVNNALYLSQDNGEQVVHDLPLPFTIYSATAQRLAKIELERVRLQILVEGTFTLKGYQPQPPESVMLSLSRFGWTNMVFEVVDSGLVIVNDAGNTFFASQLKLRQTAPGVYFWNNGMETLAPLVPNTALPSAFTVAAPTGLQLFSGGQYLYKRQDGTIFTAIYLTWTAPVDGFVTSGGIIQIQYKKSSDSLWLQSSPVEGDNTNARILDVQDGKPYDVQIRAMNGWGATSTWVTVTNYTVMGLTAPPSDVTGFAGQLEPFGIFLSWTNITDVDLDHYEIHQGSSFTSYTQAWTTKSNFLRITFQTAGTTQFFIKAVNTSGIYSTNAAVLNAVIPAPDAPQVTSEIVGTDVLFSWVKPNSQFAIVEYDIYIGGTSDGTTPPTFSTAVFTTKVTGTSYRTRVDWGGTQDFWFVTRDVAGNSSTPFHVAVIIAKPADVTNLTATVVDNHVFMRWTPGFQTSLPIDHFSCFKGPSLPPSPNNGTIKIGDVTGTFEDVVEIVGGTFTYWVQAVDSAGNASAGLSITTFVRAPPDFILNTDQALDPRYASVGSNVYVIGYGYLNLGSGGSPSGLLLAITVPSGSAPPPSTSGQPTGLLLAVTKP